MPNISILGGSPLGLIGVRSYFTPDGLSTFNAGKTRNVNVPNYNTNRSNAGMVSGNSLFSGYRVVRAWPDIVPQDGVYDTKGFSDIDYVKKIDKSRRRALHNNSVYDVSVLNIIEKLSGTKAQLRPSDFAYLKNIGVYPNNRLMVARRFASPCDDNIMIPKKEGDLAAIATLISWLPENDNFLDITFGEEWDEAPADFKGILTSLGEDFKLDKAGADLGGVSGAFGNVLPLPGFTEIFQRNFLAGLDLLDDDVANIIPSGNPNLIKKAKMRKLVGYGDAGSGLKTTVNIKMICEYELKYYSGIDPTIVWMDLLGMIGRFGTSESITYGLSKKAGAKVTSWLNNPNLLINDVIKSLATGIDKIVTEVKDAIDKTFNEKLKRLDTSKDEKNEKQKLENEKQDQYKMVSNLQKNLGDFVSENGKKLLSGLVQKYRVKIIGVINSLTGAPSTPWHITIGNPMRPTFCSGDMLVDNINVKLGPILAFNDLPTSITVEFNLTNARPWGLQEIMAKFNSGYLRTVDVQKTFYETKAMVGADKQEYIEPVGILPLNTVVFGSSGSSGTSGVAGNLNASPTKESNANKPINTEVNNISKTENKQKPYE